MKPVFLQEKQRQRAPSKRALETRARIMDAAEEVFSHRGFDGASIRDIAKHANVQGALVAHHGGSKEELFWRVVDRRSETLSQARITALNARKATQVPMSVHAVLDCFFAPFLEKAETGGPQWLAYARLVAFVSADPRWEALAAYCFDPTASRFIDEIADLHPEMLRQEIATGFVFSVSAMLALLTSRWRMNALGDARDNIASHLDELVAFGAAGLAATSQRARSRR